MDEPFPLMRFKPMRFRPISKCDFCEHSNDELIAAIFSIAGVIGDRVKSGAIVLDNAPAFASVIHLLAASNELCDRNAHRSATA